MQTENWLLRLEKNGAKPKYKKIDKNKYRKQMLDKPGMSSFKSE